MDRPRQSVSGKDQKARLGATIFASVVAVTLIAPLETHSQQPGNHILAASILPAGVAWLAVREQPVEQGMAMFRGVMLVLTMVGLGGLGLMLDAAHLHGFFREAAESPRLPWQAGVYLVAGLVGLAGSFLFDDED